MGTAVGLDEQDIGDVSTTTMPLPWIPTTDRRGGVSPQEATDLRAVEVFLKASDWAAAKPLLQRLAAANRAEPRYRALLAYVLGHEAQLAGDGARARAEWARALQLDPSLTALGLRRPRGTLVRRFFGR